ncbi:MAG TPA: CoA transferase [Pirellulales bacterium]|jgi:crotonobetainyl-CoA:carnitine CoA-transferase CaiB-like acyl-CoA transferase|nr:CoA transferase [Pirellulales bacterium]
MAEYPLAGVRVLDLSRVLAGPVCTQLLADLGADVVKVERPGTGDDTRQWGPPFLDDGGASAYFLSCNRGKRSLALDLTNGQGLAVLEELIARADVLIENFLPDALSQFGLEPQRLKQLNPGLVSCSISAFGRTGPWSDRPGYDLMIQAASGLMGITGEPDGVPMKVGVAITDVVAGLYAAVSVLAGLVGREQGQPGRAFDLSLFDCTLASLVNVAQSTLLTGKPPKRWGNAHPQIVPYEVFATSDGYLALAIGADRQWKKFCHRVDCQAWADDPRFATNPARVEHRSELVPLVAELMATQSTAEWQTLLTEIEIPHAPVATADEALASKPATARGLVLPCVDSAGRHYRVLSSPVHWFGEPPRSASAPPELGEHTDMVLRDWLDYSTEQILALRRDGAIA